MSQKPAFERLMLCWKAHGVGLTRFRGHPDAFAKGVSDAQDASTIFA